MKEKQKICNVVCGVYFLYRAVRSIINVIQLIIGAGSFAGIFNWLMIIYGVVVLSFMGIYALRQKERGQVLNSFGMGYICWLFMNVLRYSKNGFDVVSWINMALLVAAFFLSQKSSGGKLFGARDTQSEAAKMQAQTDKQNALYKQQMEAGILTREEYNQIMKNRK